MRLKLDPSIDLSDENIDSLSSPRRDRAATALIKIHETTKDSLVIAIDGDWGTGKTVFLKKVVRTAKSKGIKVIYFDSYEHDISQDAFISIASSISAFINNEFGKDKYDRFIKAAAEVGKTFLVGLSGKIVETATFGAVGVSDFEKMHQAALQPQNEIERLIQNSNDRRSALEELKSTIEDVTKENDNQNSNILFIIDELDRCRPDYAIELIECVKHIFSMNGLNFIIGADFNQLNRMIEHKTGIKTNEMRYFEKIIDFRYKLSPESDMDKYTHDDLLKPAIDRCERDIKPYFDHIIFKFLAELYRLKGLSLRTFLKLLETSNLAFSIQKGLDVNFASHIALMSALKIIDSDIYQKWISGEDVYSKISQTFMGLKLKTSQDRLTSFVKQTFNSPDEVYRDANIHMAAQYIEIGLLGDDT